MPGLSPPARMFLALLNVYPTVATSARDVSDTTLIPEPERPGPSATKEDDPGGKPSEVECVCEAQALLHDDPRIVRIEVEDAELPAAILGAVSDKYRSAGCLRNAGN